MRAQILIEDVTGPDGQPSAQVTFIHEGGFQQSSPAHCMSAWLKERLDEEGGARPIGEMVAVTAEQAEAVLRGDVPALALQAGDAGIAADGFDRLSPPMLAEAQRAQLG